MVRKELEIGLLIDLMMEATKVAIELLGIKSSKVIKRMKDT